MIIKISVIIPTFNRKVYLKKLLHQLENQVLNDNIKLNIIVVNDGSSDLTTEMLKSEFPKVILILGNGNWWWTKCINEGIKASLKLSSDFVLLLNDDNEVENNYINSLMNDYRKLKPDSILGSASISLEDSDVIDSSGVKYFNKLFCKNIRFHLRNSKINNDFYGIHECYSLTERGTFLSIKTISELGLYDENMIQYGSDEDYILSAKQKGIPIYVSWNSLVYNHTKMTSEGKFPQNLTLFLYFYFL